MSGAIDDDTRRAIAGGRESIGTMIGTAQKHLQKVFIVFVLALAGTIWLLQNYIWKILKQDLSSQAEIVFTTPFSVILLQVKIGLAVGIIVSVPMLLFFSREALRERGYWPQSPVPRWKLAMLALGIVGLFLLGVAYAYLVFFPVMFEFLSTSAINSGFKPTWSIVKWVEFIALLSLSFGIAAQLPLAMSTLAYAEIIPYETFRDKWKHAVFGLYAFGALFTPPDPITQLMWATPLVALYAISLKFTRLVVTIRRSSEQLDIGAIARKNGNVIAGSTVLGGGLVYVFFTSGGLELINSATAQLPGGFWPTLPTLSQITGLTQPLAAGLVAAAVSFLVALSLLYRYVSRELAAFDVSAPGTAEPAGLNVRELDAAGVRAAPLEPFMEMDEDESLEIAREAMADDDPDRAEAVLEKWDEAQDLKDAQEQEEQAQKAATATSGDEPPHPTDAPPEAGGDDSDTGVVTQTTTGVVDAFTEDETTEEDIGGYYYDISFILESITSRAFRIVGLFMITMAAVFMALYSGGIKVIRDDFLARLPAGMSAEQVQPVGLHPVEHLIFEIKFSVLVAIIVTLPLVLYYAWPALRERTPVTGDRRVLALWGGSLVVGVLAGSVIGYSFIAPATISWLAQDTIGANMVIAYRIKYFGWLIIYMTVGIGLLAEIPVTLFLFHYGGLVSFDTFWNRWREVVVAIFALGAVFSPKGIFTMLILAVPVATVFMASLGLLWLATLGGRRANDGEQEPAD